MIVEFSQPASRLEDVVWRKDWDVFPLKFEGSRYVRELESVQTAVS